MLAILKRMGSWMRNHWKITAMIILAIVAAIVVGALCLNPVGAPIVAGIAGISLFGAVPFAAIGTMGVAAAAASIAGLTAASVLVASTLFNILVYASNTLSQWIEPKKESEGGYRSVEGGYQPSRQMEHLRRRGTEHEHSSESRLREDPGARSRQTFSSASSSSSSRPTALPDDSFGNGPRS